MKFFSQLQLDQMKDKFFKDPEWHLIEDMFMNYIEPMKSIDNLDINDTDKAVKGEIRAKMQMHAQITAFFEAARTLANGEILNRDDERDSNE